MQQNRAPSGNSGNSASDGSRGKSGAFVGSVIVLGPLLVLAAFTALMALLAALSGWYADATLVTAAGAGTVTVVLAMVLVYQQTAERKSAGQVLHNVEARIGGLLDSAMDAIITVDDQQRIVLFNAAAEKVFAWPRSAMMGQPLDALIPERFRGSHHGHIERFGKTGVSSRRMGDRTVVTGLRANGEEFPIDASISQLNEEGRTFFTVILRDITERVRAEKQLAHSEARLRGILDSAMDAIITIDESQHVVLFNIAAEAVFGCPREQAIGAPLAWFIPERFRDAHVAHLAKFGADGTTARRMGAAQRIVMGLRRNGQEFPIEASISQISEGGARFFTVILRDVTERMRADNALRTSQEELREFAAAAHSIREQEKSRIARELHDELGQAMTALKMDVTWLTERLPDGQPMLAEKLTKMLAMLDGTVAATRRISADLRPLMLDDLGLVPAVEWLAQSFMERTGIACDLSITIAELELPERHATALFRMLQESLTNVARHAQASLVDISLDQVEGAIRLTVADNGRGFDPHDRRKPGSYGLMGLRERAYLLDGEVRIDSTRGRGTVIEVRIPIAALEAVK